LANGVASRDAAPREATPDPTLQHVHVLLLQARSSADMELQEQRCFLERCRLGPDQLASLSVLRDPLHAGVLAEADALLIGGAGEFSAHHDYPWMPSLLKLIRRAAEDGVPTFGSCWGHQVIARAFGGTVVHDSARAELGCCEVELTDAGAADALLSPFPRRFATNQGHHDRVDVLPPEAVELAFSDTQRNEAFRLAGAPVYGTQFHSELDAEAERERLIAYRDFYRADLPDEDAFQAVLDGLAETTEVDHLLHDFLVRFVLDARTAA
jgi:GMP synthase (glutamine-hydrolysing)